MSALQRQALIDLMRTVAVTSAATHYQQERARFIADRLEAGTFVDHLYRAALGRPH